MKFLLGALISWQQLIHEYLISPYSEDKNLRSRLQKLVQVWIKCCMYFFMFKRDLLMIFVAFCTSVNWSYECQLSIWVKDYYFKMQLLKEYYFSDTCFHHIKLSDRKDLCWIFALKKQKKTVYVVVQYFTEKFWKDDYSYTKSIHSRPSNRYNICVIVWFILIMVIFFANRDQCIAYFNYNSWNFETYIFRIFIQDFETDQQAWDSRTLILNSEKYLRLGHNWARFTIFG